MPHIKAVSVRAARRLALAAGVILAVRRVAQVMLGQRERHVSHSAATYDAATTRVLILGGGFGGLETALTLDNELRKEAKAGEVSILVADRNNDLLYTPCSGPSPTAAPGPTA